MRLVYYAIFYFITGMTLLSIDHSGGPFTWVGVLALLLCLVNSVAYLCRRR